MMTATLAPPATRPVRPAAMPSPRPITVAEYHRMIAAGVFAEDDQVELIEGFLVQDMARDPRHEGVIEATREALAAVLPPGWKLRSQAPVTLADSEPEPDIAAVRADPGRYMARHPGPADIGLLVEVATSSLAHDRTTKGRVYARAGVAGYWIVNLIDGAVEAYSRPDAAAGVYGQRTDYRAGDAGPLTLDGRTITVAAADVLP